VKRILTLIATIAACAHISATAYAGVPKATEVFYCNDFAGVLSDSTIRHITDANKRLEAASGAQIVVTTVDFTDGTDIASYSLKMLNEYGVGSREKNNGILLLLSIGDDDYYAQIGRGLEDYISGGAMDNLLYQYLEPDFAKGAYDEGVVKAFDAMVNSVNRVYGADESQSSNSQNSSPQNSNLQNTRALNTNPAAPNQIAQTVGSAIGNFFKNVFTFIIVIVIIIFVFSLFGGSRRRRGRRRGFGAAHVGGGFLGGFVLGRMGGGRRRAPPPRPRPPSGGFGFGGGGFGSGGFGGGFGSGGSGRGSGAGRSSGKSSFGGFGGGARGGGGSGRGAGAGRRR